MVKGLTSHDQVRLYRDHRQTSIPLTRPALIQEWWMGSYTSQRISTFSTLICNQRKIQSYFTGR